MSSYISVIITVFCIAVVLIIGTMIIGSLKNLQRSRFQKWTFLDYISVGYARHLYVKYIKRK
jgi:hypothetical protein